MGVYSPLLARLAKMMPEPYQPKEFGVFLDIKLWERVLDIQYRSQAESHSKIPIIKLGDTRVILIKWLDFGAIGLDRFERLIRIILREVHRGTEIEIGCIGGHGENWDSPGWAIGGGGGN